MQSQELPLNEQNLFRQLIKHYESKQYKKGVKTADAILKKFPSHGETVCMKGLLLNSLDRKEEAYDLAKKGLKMNLKSHVCWHVLGLLYRSDKNYAEALKSYRTALRMDPSNAQIMRDLSLLQLHQRDLLGYSETRRQLLAEKPGIKQNWISFALAEQLRGAPEAALDIVQKMQLSFHDHQEPYGRYEQSELVLYKASLCVEAKRYEQAITLLRDVSIVDMITKHELLVFIEFHLGKMNACMDSLKALLKINPSHEGYLMTLVAAAGLVSPVPSSDQVRKWLHMGESGFMMSAGFQTEGKKRDSMGIAENLVVKSSMSPSELIDELSELREQFLSQQKGKTNDQFELISLYLLPAESEIFKAKLTRFVSAKLEKGVPSTFKLLRGLYIQSDAKAKVAEEVIRSMLQKDESKSPVFETFALMCLAQHCDFVGNFSEALTSIEKAIEHTPTLVDLYVMRAKVLKHSGDLIGASKALETARELDLADRYLNSKSVKALLRIGEIEKAQETVMLFAKDTTDATKSNLSEMQCMWYEFELGMAHAKKGQVEEARKVWSGTLKHYEDMAEDEFDFAFYSIRKMTLRAYVDFLRLQDRLKTHSNYTRVQAALAEYPAIETKP